MLSELKPKGPQGERGARLLRSLVVHNLRIRMEVLRPVDIRHPALSPVEALGSS